jgi:hypothetical protein
VIYARFGGFSAKTLSDLHDAGAGRHHDRRRHPRTVVGFKEPYTTTLDYVPLSAALDVAAAVGAPGRRGRRAGEKEGGRGGAARKPRTDHDRRADVMRGVGRALQTLGAGTRRRCRARAPRSPSIARPAWRVERSSS